MPIAKLDYEATDLKQPDGTKGINDWMEINGKPPIEVVRVTSDSSGDYYYSKKFQKIKSVSVQNHGATFATGVVRDEPKLVITQGSSTINAKVTINHTNLATETFTLIIIGEY